MHELHSHLITRTAVPPTAMAVGTGAPGLTIDLRGMASVLFAITVGMATNADIDDDGIAVMVSHSDPDTDGGDEGVPGMWLPVMEAHRLMGARPLSDDGILPGGQALMLRWSDAGQTYRLGYKPDKRFVRLDLMPQGDTFVGTMVSAVAILKPLVRPAP